MSTLSRSTRVRIGGGLLLIAAALLVAASFTPLVAYRAHQFPHQVSAWQLGGGPDQQTELSLVGVAFALCAAASMLAGALMLAMAGKQGRVVHWLGTFAAGMTFGASLAAISGTVSILRLDDNGDPDLVYHPDTGFWVLVLAAVFAFAAVLLTVAAAVPVPRVSTGAPVTGALLIAAAAVAMAGSFLDLVGDGDKWGVSMWGSTLGIDMANQLAWVPLVLAVASAVVAAILQFAIRGPRSPWARSSGALAGALMAGVTLTTVLNFVSSPDLLGVRSEVVQYIRPGSWVLAAALMLSLGASIASLVSMRNAADHKSAYPAVQSNPTISSTPHMPSPVASTPVHQHHSPAVQPGLRLARIHEGLSEDGRPVITRAPLDPNLSTAVLAFLESAPLVLAARSLGTDEFEPADKDVPLSYRTDGVWVWPGAVPHYLHKHGIAPEPDLVRHIIDRGFLINSIDEATTAAAVRTIAGA
ncbi:hypothetical protein ACIP5Y_43330 [Nocardia sp. NPDC088792]|uniref:hypothetical protein n=1 Tax=Nocardia sp. NPDC088792 TaxID=3364332 RepID=UPI0038306745